MKINFSKYQAVGNDFIVIEASKNRLNRRRLPRLTRTICERRTGVGADGVLFISSSRKADCRMDVYNADGGWAEKSGNGLRIAGLHLARNRRRKREYLIQTGTSIDRVSLGKKLKDGYILTSNIGEPVFESKKIPVKTRLKYVINSPVKVGGISLPMTCLAVGNPHAVVVVDDFDFDWRALGAEIETARAFPNGTNVEFVRVSNRNKLELAEWERGAGATGSSGTGAAAAVAAMVMLGLVDRRCTVNFEYGSIKVNWDKKTDSIQLTGEARHIADGTFEYN
jgi:diaminopimelate epimerase